MRSIITLNDNWRFAKTAQIPAALPDHWERVSLPHTWNNVDGQDGGNDYWRGTACYARTFPRPALEEGGRAFLECNGAAMTAQVWLNGGKLTRHEGGYSTFRVDLTDHLRETNLLVITVDNGENDRVYPQKADFTFYGGLYRGVNLITTSKAHFELVQDGTPGIKVTPRVDLDTREAVVTVETWQIGGDAVRLEIPTEDGVEVRTVGTGDGYAAAELILQNVHLWNGVEDPFLYTVTATLLEEGKPVDAVSLPFGCRTIGFDVQKGFLLNGAVYPLRGVSRHQDWAGLGNALTMAEHRRDLELIREIGANTVRLAHYQHAQEFYDLCDEAGLVVWAEIPYITQHMPAARQNTLDQMRELITQCYHHPSIVCWGLSNEITVNGISEDLMENHRLLNDLCHRMDATRPTTMAHVFMLEQDSPLTGLSDIGSYNLYFGWYLGTLEQNDSFFDEYHRKYPDRVMGLSEYGADANPRFQSAEPEQGDYSEQYQCKYHEYLLSCIRRHTWLWATHVWNMFDFAADGRDEGGRKGVNQKGLVTMDRKLKKDAFYLYKAAWNHQEPFVHLCGSRYVDRAEGETEIRVYSNCPEVSLYVDGRFVETQQGEQVFVFHVEITGEHQIEARSGAAADTMTIRKVEQANPAYCFGQKGGVANWFDEEAFRSDRYSIRDSFGVLMSNPKTAAVVGKVMQKMTASRGDVAKSASGNENLQKMMAGMSMQSLIKQAGDAVPQTLVRQLNSALQAIPKD